MNKIQDINPRSNTIMNLIKTHHMKVFRNRMIYGMVFLLTIFFSSCKDETNNTLDLNADVSLLSFNVGNVTGTIDNKTGTITVMVPEGTDLKNIAPSIELAPNAIVKPSAGEVRDFTYSSQSPVVYRVFNGNLYTDYRVIIKEIKAQITSFRIGNKVGVINESERSIQIYLPVGTDLSALSPEISFTAGAEISPAKNAAVNFTEPVTYKLSYMGQVFTYNVEVILGEEPKKPLVIFDGENIAPRWGDLGTTVTNLTANPKTDGINATPLCVSIVRNASTGEGWHGGALWNENKVNINPAEYNRFSIMVLKNVAGDVQIEIQSDGETNKDWLRSSYSTDHLGEWQELIFEIPKGRTAMINNILVMPHEHPNGQPVAFETQRMYWDLLKALPKE
jgi:hypothetical protein